MLAAHTSHQHIRHHDPGGCPCGPRRDAPPMPNAEYVRKLPIVPWKNIAAIGGTEMISTVINKPMPPCCNAWLDKPSAPKPVMLLMAFADHIAAATRKVSCSASELTKLSIAMEN